MKLSTVSLLVLAAMFVSTAQAQNWVAFAPPEGDFRVLFPAPPVRQNEGDGSVAFKSTFDEFEYVVYRSPPDAPRFTDAQVEIQRRLLERLGSDARVRPVQDQDDDRELQGHVFEVGRRISVHRIVEYGGRYYELQTLADRDKRAIVRQTARDFFNSFNLRGISLSSIGGTLVQRVEAWCQNRTNAFARAFCEYSVCLQPGYENYPRCTALRGR